jgi:Tetratricopeptide repeat
MLKSSRVWFQAGSVRFWLAACAVGTALPAVHARADMPATPSYRALIEQGIVEYDLGHYAEARGLFTQALAIDENARVLRCLGMAEFELRNYQESADWLGRALASTAQPLTQELRASVSELLARAKGFLTRLHVRVAPASATVRVDDGFARPAADLTLMLVAGDHTLELSAPEHHTERRVLQARGGETVEWTVGLLAERVAAPPSAPALSESTRRWSFVPRLTLVMPGAGRLRRECSEALCDERIDSKWKHRRNAAPLLGVDVMYALGPSFRVGLGVHAQLNQTHARGDGSTAELGRAFYIPLTGEYRWALRPGLTLPLRASAGLLLQQAGIDMERVADQFAEDCAAFRDDGYRCTVSGPPGLGMAMGIGPGLAYELGALVLRVDLTLGFQWLRLITQEVHGGSFSGTDRQTGRALLSALSVAIEL